MGDAIREQSDYDQDPREESLVEYQEETKIEIQDIQLKGCMPQDTENTNLCKHTQDAQTFLVKPTDRIEYIHGQPQEINVFIDKDQHPFIIDGGAHCSIVAIKYLNHHFPNWEKLIFPAKAKNFKFTSGKMTSIGTIIKEIIIPHRKVKTGILPFSQKRKKLSLDIYHISTHGPLEELLNEFREGGFSTTLTSKPKLSLLIILRKNRPAFAIGQEPLVKIRGHDIELYLDVERPYPPMLRRPPYAEILETRKKIEKQINELPDMDVMRKIGHNEIVEITTPVLITCNYGKSRLYTGEDHVQYIDRILSKCTPINLSISLKKFNFGQQELLELGHKVSGLSLAIDQSKVSEVLKKQVPKNIKEMQYFLGFSIYYRNHIKSFAHITSSLYKSCSKDVVFEITKERRDEYWRIKHELTNAPLLILPDFDLPFKLYIDADCSQGLGAALYQRQIVYVQPR
ncbi:hypothetical protein O181_053383 [Austropuccinia psidii MF-1]|uniref:Reverse transcriptase/retrotransposon-derived protein RNase H-like domain-containing protein n=1 Tax=Austropuccinia psidii MF-1 TaxID=1389203 RepID=A0A9Q3HQC6_9BASI|nr:hypothetical protein [Austropuccinia psidii MF-1]